MSEDKMKIDDVKKDLANGLKNPIGALLYLLPTYTFIFFYMSMFILKKRVLVANYLERGHCSTIFNQQTGMRSCDPIEYLPGYPDPGFYTVILLTLVLPLI